jgi:hypothetical protein
MMRPDSKAPWGLRSSAQMAGRAGHGEIVREQLECLRTRSMQLTLAVDGATCGVGLPDAQVLALLALAHEVSDLAQSLGR